MSTNRTLFLYVLKKTCGMFCMQMGGAQYHWNRLFKNAIRPSPRMGEGLGEGEKSFVKAGC